MLYQHKKTGARVTVVSEWDDGEWFMLQDQEDRIFTAHRSELLEDKPAPAKDKTLQVKDKASKEEPSVIPPDIRLSITCATSQMIADHVKEIGMKTAKEINDLQMSLSGERFNNLEQLRQIKRVDWDSVFSANIIRL